MAVSDKAYLFLIPKEITQNSYIPWSADEDCWSYIGNHRDQLIEVDVGDYGLLGYTSHTTFEVVYNKKLYKNTRMLMDFDNNCCILVCYESTSDSDDIDKDYPNLYPDKKPLI